MATPVCRACYNEDNAPVLLAPEKSCRASYPHIRCCKRTDVTLANIHSCKQVTTHHEKNNLHSIQLNACVTLNNRWERFACTFKFILKCKRLAIATLHVIIGRIGGIQCVGGHLAKIKSDYHMHNYVKSTTITIIRHTIQ